MCGEDAAAEWDVARRQAESNAVLDMLFELVLAACGEDESAYEDRIKHEGRFTSAFLSVLEKSGTDTLTYAELIKRLDYLPSYVSAHLLTQGRS